MDESISSSPQKSQRSIHAARMHRKNRCRRVFKDDTMKSICTNESDAITITGPTDGDADLEHKPKLADLYWEETKPDSLNTTFLIQQPQNTDFDPFKDEMLLAVADSLDRHRKRLPRQWKTRQEGFVKCSQLMEESIKEPTPMIEYNAPLTEKSTHFDITESELLQCCTKAENDMDSINETVPSTTVHKSHKSIVESILEDFCNSPDSFESVEAHYSNDNNANKQDSPLSTSSTEKDCTPVFKFNIQPLRTYSRRSVTVAARANIAERLESVASVITDADDDGRSCSSVASLQENLIQLTEPDLESTCLNKSGNVCENLLNLSVHFSQKSTSCNASPRRESADISDSTPKRNKEINDKLLEVSAVMAENFNCQSPEREAQVNRDKLDQNLSAKDSNALSKDNAAGKEEDIFNESDEENYWNDECNFFKNFNTQDFFRKDFSSCQQSAVDRAKNENEFQGFTTASNKSITISEKAKQRAAKMIAEVDAELENDFKATQNICVFSQTRKNVATNRVANFHSVQTAAMKENIENVVLNDQDDAATTELGNIQFSEWLMDDCDDNNFGSEHIQIPEVAEMGDFKLPPKIQDIANMSNACQRPPEEPLPAFIGFLTASQKPIEISEEAKQRAAQMIAEVDSELENDFKATQNICVFSQTRKNVATNRVADEFQGFTTASKKSITISEKAKQRAAKMIAEVDAELENDFKATQNICVFSQTRKNFATNRVANFHSVQTAAMKENIENVVLNDQDDAATTELGNIQFSEWLMDDCDDNNFGSEHIQIPEVAEMGDFKLPAKIQDIANMSNACQRPPEEPLPAFIGFLTASQKPIEISEEAKAKAAKILKSLPDFPKGIPDELAEAECTLQSENMCEKYEEVPITTKRKLEHAEKYFEQIPEQAAKVVCKSNTTDAISPRTPLATCSYNAPVATTSFSAKTLREDPALSSVKKSSIISRRNLLTLNRKKRIKTKETSEENLTSTSTPLKTMLPENQMQGTPVTPNVNAFFADVPDASTPHAVHADGMQTLGNVKQTSVLFNLNEMDADFQQIEWGVCNDTSTSNKTEMSSASSSTLVETETTANPSPKIRIERLCKYGDPPQVSPILMTIKNNCRPSGLRRCRGMNKRK